MGAILEVRGLRVHYDRVEAVKGIDLKVAQGQVTSLLGANGAGKSTTLLALSGILRPSAGSIVFDGVEVGNLPPHRIVELGVIQVPEGREILTTLTVRENLLLGAYPRRGRRAIENDLDEALSLFPRLKERLYGSAGNLSGGEQQMLAIGRALMARPRLLLLDEPSMGLAPLLVREIFKIVGALKDRGLTVLLVEQNVRQALGVADFAYVMENGHVVLDAPSTELLGNPKVIDVYLGG
jgi:branched-chain amino acid transport system ATP-binding protein